MTVILRLGTTVFVFYYQMLSMLFLLHAGGGDRKNARHEGYRQSRNDTKRMSRYRTRTTCNKDCGIFQTISIQAAELQQGPLSKVDTIAGLGDASEPHGISALHPLISAVLCRSPIADLSTRGSSSTKGIMAMV